jgi:hypothetical protein
LDGGRDDLEAVNMVPRFEKHPVAPLLISLAVLLCLELPVISMSLAAGSTAAGAPNPGSAQLVPSVPTPAVVLTSTEQWAITEMERNQKVDFNARCRGQGVLDPRREDARWNDPCRRISGVAATLLLLNIRRTSQAIEFAMMSGAHIEGDVNLVSTILVNSILVTDSRIEGDVNFMFTDAKKGLGIVNSVIAGSVNGRLLHVGSWLTLTRSAVRNRIELEATKIDGDLNLDGLDVGGTMSAPGLTVGGQCLSRDTVHPSRTYF